MARTKKTARRVIKSFIPEIEIKKIDGQNSPYRIYRINNRIALLNTTKYLYLVDIS